MKQIEELERALSGRLRASAERMAPDPDALGAVRARAAARRRRSRSAVLLSSAAAVALVAVGAGIVSGGEWSSGIVAGPASGPERTSTTWPSPTTAPVDADATLLVYRFPNTTEEMIAEDPRTGGEFAELHTATQICFANGPVENLGGESPCVPSRAGELLAMVDADEPIQELARFAPNEASELMVLLSTGLATAEQVSHIVALLQVMPGVTVSSADGGAAVTVDRQDPTGNTMSITVDTSTGYPIRRSSSGDPRSAMEYVSVTMVRAADYLVPGRANPVSETATTTTMADDSEQPG